MVMLNRPNFPKTMLNYVVDSNYLMTLPLLLISIGAIVAFLIITFLTGK